MGRNRSKIKYASKRDQIISSIWTHKPNEHRNGVDQTNKRFVMLICLKLWLMQINKHFDNMSSDTLLKALVFILTPIAEQSKRSPDTCRCNYAVQKDCCKLSFGEDESVKNENCKLQRSDQLLDVTNGSKIKKEVHLRKPSSTTCHASETIVHTTNGVTGYSYVFNMKTNCYETELSRNPVMKEYKNRSDTSGSPKTDDVVLEDKDNSLSRIFRLQLDVLNSTYTVLPVFNHESTSAQVTTGETTQTHIFEPLMDIINKIADGERVQPQISMRYEMLRFCTLRSFPRENKPYITRLAEAGFYYANIGNEVVCYCCTRKKSNWRETDNPIDVHKQMNPNCSFLLRNLEVNVPIKCQQQRQDVEGLQSETSQSTVLHNERMERVSEISTEHSDGHERTSESSGSSALNVEQQNKAEEQTSRDRLSEMTRANDNNLATGSSSTTSSAKYPKYFNKIIRLASFRDCGDIVVTPDSLAEAGFFYAGFGDCVRCFQCGIGLRHWSQEDDPWIEHSRWSKECAYVRQVRGIEFVNLVQMAVQYSQNQNLEEQPLPDDPAGASAQLHQVDTSDNERLLHTDAAQSVLEMGYNPDIIRKAIRLIRASNEIRSDTLSLFLFLSNKN